MINPKNLTNLVGGIVSDPEMVGENLLTLRIAVDNAGSEKGVKAASGYFDVKYWLNNDNKFNSEWVKNQIQNGNMKKGSQIQLVGSLVHERWKDEATQSSRSKVVLVAEAITYSGSKRPENGDATATITAPAAAAMSAPADF